MVNHAQGSELTKYAETKSFESMESLRSDKNNEAQLDPHRASIHIFTNCFFYRKVISISFLGACKTFSIEDRLNLPPTINKRDGVERLSRS
jgi:hypothetical protein